MTSALAADQSGGASTIDLRQDQTWSVDLNPALSGNQVIMLQEGAVGDQRHLFNAASRAHGKLFDSQSGSTGLFKVGQKSPDLRSQTMRSTSHNRLNIVQFDAVMGLVTQRGNHNELSVAQIGSTNIVVIDQAGSHNSIAGHQSGANNFVTIAQTGVNQTIGYTQSGSGSILTIRQH